MKDFHFGKTLLNEMNMCQHQFDLVFKLFDGTIFDIILKVGNLINQLFVFIDLLKINKFEL